MSSLYPIQSDDESVSPTSSIRRRRPVVKGNKASASASPGRVTRGSPITRVRSRASDEDLLDAASTARWQLQQQERNDRAEASMMPSVAQLQQQHQQAQQTKEGRASGHRRTLTASSNRASRRSFEAPSLAEMDQDELQRQRDEEKRRRNCCQCIQPNNLGCVEKVFELLTSQSQTPAHSSSSVLLSIPSTIVFSSTAPTTWYYTDHTGHLRQHPPAKINIEAILAEFAPGVFDDTPLVPEGLEYIAGDILQSSSGSQTAATLTALDPNSTEIYAQFVYSSSYTLDPSQNYIVYLTALELLRLLRDINSDLHQPTVFGLLQRFVKPGGWNPRPTTQTHNNTRVPTMQEQLQQSNQHVYKILWSPHFTSVECRINNQRYNPLPLSSRQKAAAANHNPLLIPPSSVDEPTTAELIFSKLATFDGPAHLSKLSNVTQPLHRHKFDDMCLNIVHALQSRQAGTRIKYMELFVKIDSSSSLNTSSSYDPKPVKGSGGKPVLLYVRSLRAIHMDSHDAPPTPAHTTVCLECSLGVDFSLGESMIGRHWLPEEKRLPMTAAFVKTTNNNKNQQTRNTRPGESNGTRFTFDEKEAEDGATPTSTYQDPHEAMTQPQQQQQLVPYASNPLALIPTSARRLRPKTPIPAHLRSHPTSFTSTLTPYELSAKMDFDLMAPLPAEVVTERTLRPKVVANHYVCSANIEKRGVQLIDGEREAGATNAEKTTNGVNEQRTMKDNYTRFAADVMGLYTRDIQASRRKQLRVALQAALPQHSSTTFARRVSVPAISTCGRFLNPSSGSTKKSTSNSTTSTTTTNGIPTLADMLARGGFQPKSPTAGSQTARPSSSPSAVKGGSAALAAVSPTSVWKAGYHKHHHHGMKARPRNGSQTARSYLSRKPMTNVTASSLASTPSSSTRRSHLQPGERKPMIPRPHTSAAFYNLDPESEYLIPQPDLDQYLPNPFNEITSQQPHQPSPATSTRNKPQSKALVPVPPTVSVTGSRRDALVRFPSPPSSRPTPFSTIRPRTSGSQRVRPYTVNKVGAFEFEQFLATHPTVSIKNKPIEPVSPVPNEEDEDGEEKQQPPIMPVASSSSIPSSPAKSSPSASSSPPVESDSVSVSSRSSSRRPSDHAVHVRPTTFAEVPVTKFGSRQVVAIDVVRGSLPGSKLVNKRPPSATRTRTPNAANTNRTLPSSAYRPIKPLVDAAKVSASTASPKIPAAASILAEPSSHGHASTSSLYSSDSSGNGSYADDADFAALSQEATHVAPNSTTSSTPNSNRPPPVQVPSISLTHDHHDHNPMQPPHQGHVAMNALSPVADPIGQEQDGDDNDEEEDDYDVDVEYASAEDEPPNDDAEQEEYVD